MRPSDLYQIQRKHVRIPTSRYHPYVLICTIMNSKNRAYMGRLQVAQVACDPVVKWASWYLKSVPDSWHIWPFTRTRFKECLQSALKHLDIAKLRLTPASLRAGGASHMFERRTPTDRMQVLGRWTSTRSMHSYLQEIEANLGLLQLTHTQLEFLEHFGDLFEFTASPPQISFQQFVLFCHGP
jgi:hypothetical protein